MGNRAIGQLRQCQPDKGRPDKTCAAGDKKVVHGIEQPAPKPPYLILALSCLTARLTGRMICLSFLVLANSRRAEMASRASGPKAPREVTAAMLTGIALSLRASTRAGMTVLGWVPMVPRATAAARRTSATPSFFMADSKGSIAFLTSFT